MALLEFPGPFLRRTTYLVRDVHSYGELISTNMWSG